MRKLQLILIFSFISLTAIPNPPSKKDSIAYPIRKIIFDYSFRTDSMPIDSSIDKLHILNPAFKNEHSAVYLVRLGYPIESNDLIKRVQNNDIFIPANIFTPYIQDSKENFFYDTRRQFSSLTYKNEGAQSNNEEYLQVLHTQNLSKRTNIGFFYNLYSAYSKYNIQEASDHALDVFFRHSGDNYLTYNLFYFNSFKIQENGGIISDTLINYKTGTYDGLTVNLPEASSKFKRIGLNSIHEFKLNGLFAKDDDTTGLPEKDYGSVFYDLNLETNKRSYTDNITPPPLFYKNFYNRTLTSNDSIVLNKISNKILLNSPNLSKYLPNLRLSINNDLYYINSGDTMLQVNKQSKKDTFLLNENKKQSYSSTSTTLDISQKFRQIWWNFIWDSYFLGYFRGDLSLRLTANMFIDKAKSIELTLKGSQETRTPSFFYKNYFSNHFIWMNGFIKENIKSLSATASTKKPYFSLSANFLSVSNYVYFDSTSIPKQDNNTMYIYSFRFDNNIDIWKFNFENSILYQTNRSTIIQAPNLIFYNSTTFQSTIHFFTGGKLYFRTGFDVYYQKSYNPDAYYPDAYNPNVGAFYQQNKEKSGNYPQVDLHLTIKIKTVSFFFKYSHANATFTYSKLNAGYSGYSSFDAYHYPMLPAVFSLGINWLFYD